MAIETKNAIITSATLSTEDRGLLTGWVYLDFGGSGQGFGGYSLYLPKEYDHHVKNNGFAGHFIFRVMEMAGVGKWENLKGKTVRVKAEHSKVHAIGHIIEDKWFEPSVEFKDEK